jgi:hypothetical protein
LLRELGGEVSKISDAPRTTNIIAIDPGKVTGVAVVCASGGFASLELPADDALDLVWKLANIWVFVDIVSERYTVTQRTMTPQTDALEMNGALRFIARRIERPFKLQGRSEVKKAISDAVLRDVEWFVRTKDGHANDAARQLGFHVLQSDPVEWLRFSQRVQ